MKSTLNTELLAFAVATALAATGIVQAADEPQPNTGNSTSGQLDSTPGTTQGSLNPSTPSTTTSPSTVFPGSSTAQEQMKSEDGIVRQHGSSYYLKEGHAQKIEKELKLSEGITAEKDGKVTLKDGTELKLDDGKMVTLKGDVVNTPPEVAAKIHESNTTGTTGTQPTE